VTDEPKPQTELEWCGTAELLDELMRRFDSAVFCGTKGMTDEMNHDVYRWAGLKMTCVGMATHMSAELMELYRDEMYGDDEEDAEEDEE
jgi:hypothetical protein